MLQSAGCDGEGAREGFSATRAIRALEGPEAAVPILALSADVGAAEISKCLAAGMNGHVPKPIHREQLIQAVGEALDGRSDRPEAAADG